MLITEEQQKEIKVVPNTINNILTDIIRNRTFDHDGEIVPVNKIFLIKTLRNLGKLIHMDYGLKEAKDLVITCILVHAL